MSQDLRHRTGGGRLGSSIAGDLVPADIRLTAAKDLLVSQSVITGERAIWEKDARTLSSGQARSCAG